MSFLGEFIESLTALERMFFYIALAGTVFFLLQSVFTFLDLGDQFDSDSDFDGELDSDFSFLGLSLPFNLFSIRGIVSFMMIFGWTGLSVSRSGLNPFVAFLIAFVAGFVMMVIVGLIYYSIYKLGDSGNVNLKDAVGRQCEVYLTVPEKQEGLGKVHLIINGSLREYDAITLGERILSGEHAKVIDIMNDKLVVEKI